MGGGVANKACSAGTVFAGAHAAMPGAQTRVAGVTWPLAIPACSWATLNGPPDCPLPMSTWNMT